jgi:hypothetical protein
MGIACRGQQGDVDGWRKTFPQPLVYSIIDDSDNAKPLVASGGLNTIPLLNFNAGMWMRAPIGLRPAVQKRRAISSLMTATGLAWRSWRASKSRGSASQPIKKSGSFNNPDRLAWTEPLFSWSPATWVDPFCCGIKELAVPPPTF